MTQETLSRALAIRERIEHCNHLVQQLRKASQMLSGNEGLVQFLEAFNEMNNGEYLMGEIVDQIIGRYQKTIHEYEDQLAAL